MHQFYFWRSDFEDCSRNLWTTQQQYYHYKVSQRFLLQFTNKNYCSIKLFHNFLWIISYDVNIDNEWNARIFLSCYQTAEVWTPQQSDNYWAISWLLLLFMQHVIIGANNLTKRISENMKKCSIDIRLLRYFVIIIVYVVHRFLLQTTNWINKDIYHNIVQLLPDCRGVTTSTVW